MAQSQIRNEVARYLGQHGTFEDMTGRATAKLRVVLGYEGSDASFTQLIASMDRAGQLTREIRGKRTYRITAVTDASPSGVEQALHAADKDEIDYDKLASALLVEVVQTVTGGGRQPGSDGSWARRRIERLERRINELERNLSQAKAESKTLAAARDELRIQLEHSQANLALLADRLPNGKPREGQLSKLLGADDRALLRRLRGSAVDERPDRAG